MKNAFYCIEWRKRFGKMELFCGVDAMLSACSMKCVEEEEKEWEKEVKVEEKEEEEKEEEEQEEQEEEKGN